MEDLKAYLTLGVKDIISSGLKKIEARFSSVEKSAQELENKLKTLKGFKDLSRQMEDLEKQEQSLIKEHTNLKAQKAKLEAELKKLIRAYEEGKISTEDFESSHERLKNQLLTTEQKLVNLENQLRQVRSEKQRVERETLQLRQELNKLGIEVKDVDRLIEQYEKELKELSKTAEETSGKLGLITKGLKGLGAIGGAGILTGAVKGMFDLEAQARRIVFNTTLTWEKHKDRLIRDIADLKSETLASYEEISLVITRLVQETGKYDETTKETAKSVLMLKRTLEGWDEREITRAVAQLQRAYKLSGKEAAQLIYTVYHKAGDKAGDLLDTFWEYVPILAEAGIKADELAAILIAGAKEGAFNYDKLADSLKELNIRLSEASNLEQLIGNIEEAKAGLIDELWGRGSEEWLRMKSAFMDYISAVQQGDKELTKSSIVNLISVVTKAYKKDAIKTQEILTSMFGAVGAEDVAKKVLQGIAKGIAEKDKYLKDAKDLQKAYEDSFSSLEKMKKAWTSIWQNIVITARPAFDVITKGLEAVAGFMEEHRTLSTALVGGIAVIGSLGLAVKGLSLAFGVAKSGLSIFLTPFRLFKREAQTTCAITQGIGQCITDKAGKFRRLGFSVRGLIGSFRSLAGAGRLLLGGLRLLGLTNPFGLAITGITIFGPKLWNLIGGVEGLKKSFSKVKGAITTAFEISPLGVFAKGLSMIREKASELGKTLLNGIKGLWDKAREKGGSLLLKGIKAVPMVGSVLTAYQAGKALTDKGKDIEQLAKIETSQTQSVKNTTYAPNITINLPSINVMSNKPEEIRNAILQALEEGGERVKELLLKYLQQIDQEERPVF